MTKQAQANELALEVLDHVVGGAQSVLFPNGAGQASRGSAITIRTVPFPTGSIQAWPFPRS